MSVYDDSQRPDRLPDLHPTVLRLNAVAKLRKPRTDEHLETALRDLASIGPWRQAPPGQLANDLRETIDRAAPALRNTVRLTLGLDKPRESLTTRRQLQPRPSGIGGEGHLLIEYYAFSQILYALVMTKAIPALLEENALGGFVIRDVTLHVLLGRHEEGHHVTLLADCQRDGERVLLVPTVFSGPAVGIVCIAPDSAAAPDRVEVCELQDAMWIDSTAPDYGYYHVVPFERPVSAGARVRVDLSNLRSKRPVQQALTSQLLWWRSLGTEQLITLAVVAPAFLVTSVRAVDREPGRGQARSSTNPGDEKAHKDNDANYPLRVWSHTWDLTREASEAGHLFELRWGFRKKGLTRRGDLAQNVQLVGQPDTH